MGIEQELNALFAEVVKKQPLRMVSGKGDKVHIYKQSDDPKYFYIEESLPRVEADETDEKNEIAIKKYPMKLWDKLVEFDKKRGYKDMAEFGASFHEDMDWNNFLKNKENLRDEIVQKNVERYRNKEENENKQKEAFLTKYKDVDEDAKDAIIDLAKHTAKSEDGYSYDEYEYDGYRSCFFTDFYDKYGAEEYDEDGDPIPKVGEHIAPAAEDFEKYIKKYASIRLKNIESRRTRVKEDEARQVGEKMEAYLESIIDIIEKYRKEKSVTIPKIRKFLLERISTINAISTIINGDVKGSVRYLDVNDLRKASTKNIVCQVEDVVSRIEKLIHKEYSFHNSSSEDLDEELDYIRNAVDRETANAITDAGYETLNYDDIEEKFKEKGIVIKKSDSKLDEIAKKGMDSITAFIHEKPESYRCWYVTNSTTASKYEKTLEEDGENANEHILWHGSVNENWLPIVIDGLMMEKAGAGMFGAGIYFANKAGKSYGYTSGRDSRWSNGNENRLYLALFRVNIGKTFEATETAKGPIEGYDSISAYAHKGFLQNDEFIIYDDSRCTIYALVEVALKEEQEDEDF